MDQCLLNLGASVNLLSHYVYRQLGLGALHPTNYTLLLADRPVKVSKRIVKNVILKVDEFYFPADFIVLDTELVRDPSNHFLVILG